MPSALGIAGGIRGFRFDNSPLRSSEEQRAGASWVSPRYFETLGIPLFEGREFTAADSEASAPGVMINRTMAWRYTGTGRAVGRRLEFNGKSYEIVGVAADAKHSDLRSSADRPRHLWDSRVPLV